MLKRNYVGVKVQDNGVLFRRFLSDRMPTPETHGLEYSSVLGPFPDKTTAMIVVHYGYLNPHCQCVHDAMRLVPVLGDKVIGKDDEKIYLSH